jgi:intein-encoded DNA endonuclease-like protein
MGFASSIGAAHTLRRSLNTESGFALVSQDRQSCPRHVRPYEVRVHLWKVVMEMKARGLKCGAIAKELERTEGVHLDTGQICDWVHKGHSPMGRVKQFSPDSSPELAYVIGVRLGDASLGISKYNFNIKLRVTDFDFAREFSRCLCTVLRRKVYEPRWMNRFSHWYVSAGSMLLFKYLSGPIELFRDVIEHDDACASAFLRGFFDSEGSASGRSLTVYNANLKALEYVKFLLVSRFSIECSGPHLGRRGGGTKLIRGRLCRVNKDSYYLSVRRKSIHDFSDRIGFSIARKNSALRRGMESCKPPA